ncbi:alpha/beta fold hydrolase BchO [Aestuariivirga sp.]|uniref:alpha/beta fold hydrolase BchO n=1 Tax=Aestuariivirga sp. TaxID=2650926 RepID=UPI0025C336E9|nr:alpha/beta fold hydrolase BchO [Aestuariivirga sp.]MCA3555522.1 alpha/beta fold hydrolase [Aestuariivirga sp.]
MGYYLDWKTDGAGWPNNAASRFVDAAGMPWHVQVMGEGPALLLLHGTGAATHSWRGVMPKLAAHYTVVAMDLPGHAFTQPPSKTSLSLPGMAAAVASLLRTLKVEPVRAAGHSAGAAVLVRMAVERLFAPDDIISFNGAFFPVTGVAGQFFSPLAKTFASAAIVRKMFAKMADRKAVERLLRDTGSKIDAEGISLYQKLFSNEGHIAGTLGMMAAWDLHWAPQDLKNLPVPIKLAYATGDRTIAPARAAEAAKLAPRASLVEIRGLGHLAHEEDPAGAAAIIADPASFTLR